MNQNKSAFPFVLSDFRSDHVEDGLTKREYIATQAMNGFVALPNEFKHREHLVQTAVQYADALLEELEKASGRGGGE